MRNRKCKFGSRSGPLVFVERVIELNIPKSIVFANGVDIGEANGIGRFVASKSSSQSLNNSRVIEISDTPFIQNPKIVLVQSLSTS